MEANNSNVMCSSCNKTFSKACNLYRHMRTVHQEIVEIIQVTNNNISCPICLQEVKPQNYNGLESHIESNHNLSVKREHYKFNSMQEFKKWKLEIEETTQSKYSLHEGKRQFRMHQNKYFYCNRTGYFQSKGLKNERQLKTQGSCKMNSNCPNRMKLKICNETNQVHVDFVRTHVGHEQNLGHLFLNDKDRKWIASKLNEGVEINKIIDEVRSSVCNENPNRLHLLTKKDIRNIEISFQTNSVIRNKDDKLSVETWVKEMENVVMLYKPQGIVLENHRELLQDDFFLAIMNQSQIEMLQKFGKKCITTDTTHGMNSYGFDLTTILIVDDLHCGFPVAFLFSSKIDEITLRAFYSLVREKAGLIHTNVFMTDDAPAYYNAWREIMCEPVHHLLCTWHVDRAWQNNLNKIKIKENRVIVYKMLRVLLQETDETNFGKMIENFIAQLNNNEDTKQFMEYFVKYYVGRPKLWAFCYRLHTGINTNMHIESMHKNIKYIYLQGKKVKRLDKTLNALMRFLRDQIFSRIIKISKGAISSKLSVLRKRHLKSKTINDLQVLNINDGKWLISSESSEENYTIILIEDKKDCSCSLKCNECDACIHKFNCTCVDNSIRWNMCKHIHYLCQHIGNNSIDNNNNVELSPKLYEDDGDRLEMNEADNLQEINDSEIRVHIQGLKRKHTDIDTLKVKIKKDLEVMLHHIDHVNSYEKLNKFYSERIKPVLMTAEVLAEEDLKLQSQNFQQTEENREPGNKKIKKQGFYSTKKCRSAMKKKKPTPEEVKELTLKMAG